VLDVTGLFDQDIGRQVGLNHRDHANLISRALQRPGDAAPIGEGTPL
jgi:hypothetical protein